MAQKKTTKTTKRKPPARSRKKKASPSKKWDWKKISAVSLGGCLLIGLFFFILIWTGLFGKIPTRATLQNIQHPIASEVYGYDGSLLGKYFIENRSQTEFDEISPFLIQALVATEDARFYAHRGVDLRSLVRVLFKTVLLMDKSSGGGSTISQQLAKNLFPRQKYFLASTLINKTREMITATRIEKVYSKEQILTLYLNTVPFGENVFGIGVATERFFDTHPSQITPEQSATLIGMLKATTYYSPRRFPERAKTRRNIVFDQMEKYGYITSAESAEFKERPLELNYSKRTDTEGLAMYFRKFLHNELKDWCETHMNDQGEPYNLYTDGLKIYTSIDPTLQSYAEQAVNEVVDELQEKFDQTLDSWKPYYQPLEQATKRSRRYQQLTAAGMNYKEIQATFAKETQMSIYKDGRMQQVNMSPIDSIKHYLRMLQGAFLVMQPKTGEIKAWVGGTDHRQFGIDYVTSPRQVGSTFKPFVYGAALEEGYDVCTYYDNERFTYEDFEDWSPRNSNGEYGGSYTMAGALTNSINTVSVQVLFDAGIEHTIDLAHRCGVESKIPEVPSIALGTAELSLLEMVNAYSTIANDGYKVNPTYLYRIEDQDGNILEEVSQQGYHSGEQVLSDSVTSDLIHMMRKVVDEGTAKRLRFEYGLNFEIAGKTGTTQNQSDGWFIGMTPNLVAGAWVGANDRRIHFQRLSDGQGARTALPIWGTFFSKLIKDPKYKTRIQEKFDPYPVFASYESDCIPYSEYDADYLNTLYESDDDEIILLDERAIPKRARRIDRKKSSGLKSILESIFGKKEDKPKRKKNRKKRKKKKN